MAVQLQIAESERAAGYGGRSAAAVGVGDPDELAGVREWQGTDQEPIHDAEDRGVGADAERERDQRYRGKAMVAAKDA